MSIEEAQQLHSEGRYDESRVIYEHEIEHLDGILSKITAWYDAYPKPVFVEPTKEQWLEAHHLLNKAKGCTLAAISASRRKHVLNGIWKIINKEQPSVEEIVSSESNE
jgi:hypothetical protein